MRRPYYLGFLAAAYRKAGQIDQGLKLLDEALIVVEEKGERWWEAELCRLKGELMMQISELNQADSEGCFRRAVEIARNQGAKSLELRAVMSLSRLQQKQGKKDKARKMLLQIYGWFTEGFDTADLKDAKALLEELS